MFFTIDENTKRTQIVFWAMMALGLVSWLVFIKYPFHSDDTGLYYISTNLDLKTFSASFFTFRYGCLLPMWLINKIFGVSLFSYYLFSLLTWLLWVAVVFILSYQLSNSLRAAVASFIVCISDYHLNYYSSMTMPDIPCTAFNLLAVLFFFAALKLSEDDHKYFYYLFASAFFAFWAYLTRMPNSVFLITLPIAEILICRRLKYTMIFSFIFLCFIGCELLANWYVFSDPLIRYKIIFSKGMSDPTVPIFKTFIDFLMRLPRTLGFFATAKIICILGFMGIIIAVFKKNMLALSLTFGALSVFILYALPVNTWEPLQPKMNLCIRHYYLLITFLYIMFGYALFYLVDKVTYLIKHQRGIVKFINFLAFVFCLILVAGNFFNQHSHITLVMNHDNIPLKASKALKLSLAKKDWEIQNFDVYSLPGTMFFFYPGFNTLNVINGDINAKPKAPCVVLLTKRGIRFYNNQFTSLGNLEYADYFLSLLRPTQYATTIFETPEVIMLKIDQWVDTKELVFSLNDINLSINKPPVSG
ncbi:MAG: glycosyltransferase family 39 protein [Desulfobacteraceae bacterium]|nr:glycosyltransferase family 39 protein [Desulfobacteraceae bacterium]